MCYFELIYLTGFVMKFLRTNDWSLFSLWFQVLGKNQQKAAKQVSNKSATNPLSTPRNGIYETTATLRVTLCFSYFMSFTAPFVCESHHLRFNRKKTPQKAVLFHVLAAFRVVVLLYYELISSLWDDGTHLGFCYTSLHLRRRNTHPSAHARTHVRAPLLWLPLSVWPHSRFTWLMGFHPCSAPSEASLSPLSPVSAPCRGHAMGVLLCWMTEQCASKLLWAKRDGLWAQNTSK